MMTLKKATLLGLTMCFSAGIALSQVYIDTGNPDLESYKSSNSSGVGEVEQYESGKTQRNTDDWNTGNANNSVKQGYTENSTNSGVKVSYGGSPNYSEEKTGDNQVLIKTGNANENNYRSGAYGYGVESTPKEFYDENTVNQVGRSSDGSTYSGSDQPYYSNTYTGKPVNSGGSNNYSEQQAGDNKVIINTGNSNVNTYKSGAYGYGVESTPKEFDEPNTVNQVGRSTTGGYGGSFQVVNTNNGSEYLSPTKGSDVPPFAQPGKCYARCFIPEKFEFRKEKVLDQPASFRTETTPAVYETMWDTVVVTPATVRYEDVPAEYKYVEEQVMIEPAQTVWKKGEADKNCLSNDPKDCEVMCLVEMPAKYETVTKEVLVAPSYQREVVVPAVTRVEPRKVIVQEASTRQIPVEATYKTVMSKVSVGGGGYQEWREILCSNDVTVGKIHQIQSALRNRGYNPGPTDNILGPQTKAALKRFQEENNLPVGNLNLETLNALGIDY